MARPIIIFDTTLRDGEQSPGVSLTSDEKLEIAKQLAKLKVDVIEAGFPITSSGDAEAVKNIAETVKGPVICALARCNALDIEKAWESISNAGRPRIHVFIATSDIHMKHKLRKSPDEVIEMAKSGVALAKSFTSDVEFSAEDATRSDPEFLRRIFTEVIAAGATTINIPDTVGYTSPREFKDLIVCLRENTPGIKDIALSVHCHNDLGLATANSLAVIEAGVDQIECTINGLGERAGNTALEEIAMALVTRSDYYDKRVNIATEQIYRTSKLVSSLTAMVIQPNKAIVGRNAFAHQSGIHQDGVLKERTTYEIMRPEAIGLPSNKIVLGKVSGRHAFRARLQELGYTLNEEDISRAFERFKQLADRKKEIEDKDIEAIVEHQMFAAPEYYRLEYYHIVAGNQTLPTATVRVSCGEALNQEASTGDGPVDALFRAIDRAIGLACHLKEYTIRAVTGGKDALGEVLLKVQVNGRCFSGRAISTDVVEASAKAYVSALNRIRHDLDKGIRIDSPEEPLLGPAE